jgi:transposase
VQRQREDFAPKTANALVSSHDLLASEHLAIRKLVKKHQLAKSIHDGAWGQFLNWVKAYGIMHDVPVIAVPPQPEQSGRFWLWGGRQENALHSHTGVSLLWAHQGSR